MLRSLSSRLIAAATIGLVVATAAGAGILSLIMWPSDPGDALRAELVEEVSDIAEGMQVAPDGTHEVTLRPKNAALYDAMQVDAAYEVLDEAGRVVAQSPAGAALDALRSVEGGANEVQVLSHGVPITVGLIERDIRHGDADYIVRVARSQRLVTTLKENAGELYLRALMFSTLVSFAIFLLVVFLTVTRMVRPIREVSSTASRIEPRNLGTRLDGDRLPTELRPLIAAFNTAIERLETGFKVQQQFLASAAHELKTPLALLQGEIELGGAANRTLLLRDTALMARQVQQLLQLAEVSEGHNLKISRVALLPILQDAAQYIERIGDPRDVTVVLIQRSGAAPEVEADSAAVFVLAKNLLENAVLYSPIGESVHLTLAENGFDVQDEGQGVSEADRSHLFSRFWRARDATHNGAGLGLAICREICDAHDWTVELDPEKPGACFSVRFNRIGREA